MIPWKIFKNIYKWKIMRKPNLTETYFRCYTPGKDLTCVNGFYESLIMDNTVESRDHLTPELKLRLITPECELWYSRSTESIFPNDPFWAIYWPGGQALGRYILDNKNLFENKNVIDIGSGSGACALAAAKSGANLVLANDTDPVSVTAISINSKLNNLKVHINGSELIGKNIDFMLFRTCDDIIQVDWNIILVGDMFYDSEFSSKLFTWLSNLVKNQEKKVYVGDPGRHGLRCALQINSSLSLVKVAEYELLNTEKGEFSFSAVYTIECTS